MRSAFLKCIPLLAGLASVGAFAMTTAEHAIAVARTKPDNAARAAAPTASAASAPQSRAYERAQPVSRGR